MINLLHRGSVGAIVALTFLAAASPGFAQQGWTGVVTDLFGRIDFGAMAADASGNVRVIWSEPLGDGVHTIVLSTERSALTDEWSTPAEAYRTASDPGAICNQLVVADDGSATASCAEGSDTPGSLFALCLDAATGEWSRETLEAGGRGPLARLAMDGAGNTHAIWSANTLRYRRHTALAHTWDSIVELPVAGVEPRIALDSSGNLFLTWRTYDAEGRITINAAHYEAAAARWGRAPGILLPSHALGEEQAAVDEAGHGMVLWAQSAESGAPGVRAARYDASTASFGPVVVLSGSGAEFSEPRLVMDAEGNALAVWRARYSGHWRVEAAAYIAGAGRWTPAANASADTRLRAMGSGLRAQGFGLWAQGFGS